MRTQARPRAQQEMLWGMFAHLGGAVFGFLAPLSVWLAWRRRSPLLARSAKEALNMQLSYLAYLAIAVLCVVLGVGIALPVLVVTWLVFMVFGALGAGRLEVYRYPAIFRPIS